MTHTDWEWSKRVNLWGPIHGAEAFTPRRVAEKRGGHILFTASFAGHVPNQDLGPYSVTKSALVALAECLCKDLRSDGIGVSAPCPMRVPSRIDYSFRNRPQELGVAEVAELVIDAMRNQRPHIHTHTKARQYVRRGWERMDAAFQDAL